VTGLIMVNYTFFVIYLPHISALALFLMNLNVVDLK